MQILIAVDIGETGETAVSPSSKQAVSWGNLLAQFTGAIPNLLAVVKHESARRQARTVLEMTAEMMTAGPVTPPTQVVVGRAAEEIVRVAICLWLGYGRFLPSSNAF